MTFANFVTIQFALLIDRVPQLNAVFPNLWIFAAVFVTGYVPIAIVIGYWHRKSQWKVEQEAMFNENIVQAKMWLFMLELIDGKVTEEEKREMRKMLRQIIKKNPTSANANTKDAVTDNTKGTKKLLEQSSNEDSQ